MAICEKQQCEKLAKLITHFRPDDEIRLFNQFNYEVCMQTPSKISR